MCGGVRIQTVMNLRNLLRTMYCRLARRDADPDSFMDRVHGVIHIGANTGQESGLYALKGLNVLWIEPIPSVFQQLLRNINGVSGQSAVCELLSDRDGELATLNIANNGGESSSIMDLKEHMILWPNVNYVDSIVLPTKTLVSVVHDIQLDLALYNSLVLDTQGSELLILKGALPLLPRIAYIKTEVPDFEAYEGCPLIAEFTEFMQSNGFQLVSKRASSASSKTRAYYDVTYRNRRYLG